MYDLRKAISPGLVHSGTSEELRARLGRREDLRHEIHVRDLRQGTLTIARPSVKEYKQIDRVKVMEAQDAWAPLAIADGYLVLRDSETMVCMDVAKNR